MSKTESVLQRANSPEKLAKIKEERVRDADKKKREEEARKKAL